MAEKDFKDFGFTDLFKKSVEAIKWFARIGKHIGDVTIRSFDNVRFSENNSRIGIKNEDGEYLYVPKYILDMYVSSHPKAIASFDIYLAKQKMELLDLWKSERWDPENFNSFTPESKQICTAARKALETETIHYTCGISSEALE